MVSSFNASSVLNVKTNICFHVSNKLFPQTSPAYICLFKVNDGSTRTMYEICLKFICSKITINNFEQITHGTGVSAGKCPLQQVTFFFHFLLEIERDKSWLSLEKSRNLGFQR